MATPQPQNCAGEDTYLPALQPTRRSCCFVQWCTPAQEKDVIWLLFSPLITRHWASPSFPQTAQAKVTATLSFDDSLTVSWQSIATVTLATRSCSCLKEKGPDISQATTFQRGQRPWVYTTGSMWTQALSLPNNLHRHDSKVKEGPVARVLGRWISHSARTLKQQQSAHTGTSSISITSTQGQGDPHRLTEKHRKIPMGGKRRWDSLLLHCLSCPPGPGSQQHPQLHLTCHRLQPVHQPLVDTSPWPVPSRDNLVQIPARACPFH